MGVLSQVELCRRVSSMLTWPLTDPGCTHSWESVLEPRKQYNLRTQTGLALQQLGLSQACGQGPLDQRSAPLAQQPHQDMVSFRV